MKILLVEDDDIVRDAICAILKYRRHTVDTSASAEEALIKLPGDYDLVISDIMLPRMDGVALLEKVNQMKPRIPVVMITGLGGVDIENICRQKGAAGFLQKPFGVHRLLSMVEEAGKNPDEV
jgi:DNA-binding NtrC family response regulator